MNNESYEQLFNEVKELSYYLSNSEFEGWTNNMEALTHLLKSLKIQHVRSILLNAITTHSSFLLFLRKVRMEAAKSCITTLPTDHLDNFKLMDPNCIIDVSLQNQIILENAEVMENFLSDWKMDLISKTNAIREYEAGFQKLLKIRKLDSGESLLSIIDTEEHFPTWFSYNRSLVMYYALKQPKRNFKTFCVYFYGDPGVGKSRLSYDISKNLFPDVTPYYKTKGQWWDLFSNEMVIIWDDFRGDCYEAQELFRLCDRYDYKVQVKGGFMNFNSKVILFTSNINSVYLYRDTIGIPLERRLDIKYNIISYDAVTVKYVNCHSIDEGVINLDKDDFFRFIKEDK